MSFGKLGTNGENPPDGGENGKAGAYRSPGRKMLEKLKPYIIFSIMVGKVVF
jgi:hypothetical protein